MVVVDVLDDDTLASGRLVTGLDILSCNDCMARRIRALFLFKSVQSGELPRYLAVVICEEQKCMHYHWTTSTPLPLRVTGSPCGPVKSRLVCDL